jgi:pyruvate kinase
MLCLIVCLAVDTKGPEIRTGVVDASLAGKLKLTKGAIIEVGTDYSRPCTPEYLACSYASLPTSVAVGGRILVADGALILEVTEVRSTSVMARIMNNASFGDRKNMNLPGAIVDLPTLTPKDIDDLVNFGLVYNVDYIAASFVRKAEDIDFIRSVLTDAGKHIKIIAKIENQEGLSNYDDILLKTDGIMVARGDLGMEIPIEKVFIAQKMMIQKANAAGKPVITATQMMESMITNPRPTRAECSDVANAVLDGSDAVMLSGESANGEYPFAAVRSMATLCTEAESMLDYCMLSCGTRCRVKSWYSKSNITMSTLESAASAAVSAALDSNAKLLVVGSETGTAMRLVAKYRPQAPVVAFSANGYVARQSSYVRGASCVNAASVDALINEYKSSGRLVANDVVVVLPGESEALATVQIVTV